MARYIKANPLVAKFLHLEDVRNTVKDGNYLLWQADMQTFGPLSSLPSTLEQIGGIVLTPHEAREEQDGTVTRPLPTATDPRFVPVASHEETPSAEGGDTETQEGGGMEPEPENTQEQESGSSPEEQSGQEDNTVIEVIDAEPSDGEPQNEPEEPNNEQEE